MILRLKLWGAAIGFVVAALAASWFGGRKSAQTDAKIATLKQENKSHELRNEVENRVAAERDARNKLRDEWSR